MTRFERFSFRAVLLQLSFLLRGALSLGMLVACLSEARVVPPLALVNGTFLPGGEYNEEGPVEAAHYGFPQSISLESLQLLSVSKSPSIVVDGSFAGVFVPHLIEETSVLSRKKATYRLAHSDWQEDKVCGKRERRVLELKFYWNSSTGWIDTNSIRVQATYEEWVNACLEEPSQVAQLSYLFQD